MFATLKVKQLRSLIRDFKRHHDIRNSSKMKKAQLVEELEKRFQVIDGKLFLKSELPQPKAKKVTNNNNDNNMTAGQQRYKNTVNAIENKALALENYKKDSTMAKRLKGK
jgi:hypothetical protein